MLQGFGGSKGGSSAGKGSAQTPAPVPAPAPAAADGYWNDLKLTLADLQAKPRQPLILANGKSVIVWLVDGAVFCTAAAGTAFEYPLVDAVLFTSADGKPAVRCTLDGCEYDLASGAVLAWCPKEEAPISMRNLFAGLKQNATPVPLPVYKTRVNAAGGVEALFPVAK